MSYEAVFCIVNSGYSDTVMEVARESGATGGTIINARGTANGETEKLFNITVHPEKEILLIIVPKNIKEKMLKSLYAKVGIKEESQGIVFSVPVMDIAGIGEKK